MKGRKGQGTKENRETRERNKSCGSIVDMWKRKREDLREGVGRKEGEVFETSKKTVRSPD